MNRRVGTNEDFLTERIRRIAALPAFGILKFRIPLVVVRKAWDGIPVIESFGDKQTGKLWRGQRTRFPADLLPRAIDKLNLLDATTTLDTLRIPPSNRLEALKGDRAGQHSIRINDQWRICFRWEAGSAQQVEITDYH